MSLTFCLLVTLTLAPCFSSSSTTCVCPGIQAITSGVSYKITTMTTTTTIIIIGLFSLV